MSQSIARLDSKRQVTLNGNFLTDADCDDMSIGARIVKLRATHKPKKLSQEELGKLCGVSKSAVSQWESGATDPDLKTLLSLKEKLDFSLDWLLTGKGEPGATYKNDPLMDHVIETMRTMRKKDVEKLVEFGDSFAKGRRGRN